MNCIPFGKTICIALIIEIMTVGLGYCGHTHEHFDHITEDHTHFYAFNQHIDDNHESSSNPYYPDHNTSENKYRCGCLGGLIGIVQSFENHLPLPFLSIILSQTTTYDYRLIPYIFHPPLIR